MSDNLEILRKYSEDKPIIYTPEIRKEIAGALFEHLTEEQLSNKVKRINWLNHKSIQALCSEKISRVLVESNPQIEEKKNELAIRIDASLIRQREKQVMAITEQKIQKVSSINMHTIIEKLSKRTSKAEYKYQLSRSPLLDDEQGIKHTIVEPYECEKEGGAINEASYPLIIENSVYKINSMPTSLVDLALHGKMKNHYTISEKLDILLEGANNEDVIKKFLINAQPLGFSREKPQKEDETPTTEYTQRILGLSFQGQRVGYLLSENTHIAYEEKNLKQYTNNIIRYNVFGSKNALINHLHQEKPSSLRKIFQRDLALGQIWHSQNIGLAHIYAKPSLYSEFFQYLGQLKTEVAKGGTIVEQRIAKSLEKIHGKNAASDQMVLDRIARLLRVGVETQKEKLRTMEAHIHGLEKDPDF